MLASTGVLRFCHRLHAVFLILAYLVYNGGKSVNFDFFTKLPASPGQVGGGMANAIVGSAEIIALASLLGIPVGFLAGIYLAEFGGKTFAFLIRYTADLPERGSVHRDRHFAWTVIVVPMHGFFPRFGRRVSR